VHNTHRKHQNTHKNPETKVGNHRNPLPLWQACIYPALGTGDLQCSPGFLQRAAIHRALPLVFVPKHAPLQLTPQTRLNAFPTSVSRKEETTDRLLSKSHETHCDLLMTESATTPRTHLTQAHKAMNNRKKKRKRTLQSRSYSAVTIIP